MAKAKTPPTHFIVGTKNSNGEECLVFTDEHEAHSRLKDLIEDGFEDDELIWIEGHRKRVSSSKVIFVEALELF